MTNARLWGLAIGAVAAGLTGQAGARAQGQPPIPSVVLTHMQSLDARCLAAGGREGPGRYVAAQDFTGDGRLDYLLSEGDYNCAGRPGLFRKAGQARVDIFVTDARGQSRRVYSDVLAGYRIVAGRPAKVQVARRGAACGGGAGPGAQCAAQLEWNGTGFGQGVSVARAAPGAPSAAASAPPPPVSAPAGEAEFLARCRRELVSRDASAARWADEECRGRWGRVVASGPAADFLISAVPRAGERASLAGVRAGAQGVRWAARPEARQLASGTLGDLKVGVAGAGQPAEVSVGWQKIGAEIPYDVAEALRQRGARVDLAACEKLGVGEGEKAYAVSLPGRAPFGLTVFQRTAPTGNAWSSYSATVSLDGRQPRRGATGDCDF
ncbi:MULTISPECIES: hypothetical protein [unclassified Phenylobacterium]|uniref:hypothetical protein n=1 Tax=unclassified Phenylobacterium TaxID=2640670 RepID=UPI000A6A2955|nr:MULTISPECIES: hypothetical protein [unclassified Phenylobacterium]